MNFIFCFAVLLLAGCSKHYSAAELVGKYILSVNQGADIIQLEPNGTYVHIYNANDKLIHSQSGEWGLEALQAGPTVVLKKFHFNLSEDIKEDGYYLLLVEGSFPHIRLITDIDLNEGYEREP
jgi:hypothetical protein